MKKIMKKVMKKVMIPALSLVLVLGIVGCSAKKEDNVDVIGGADGPTSIYLESEGQKDVLTGTWQTASMGYEVDGEMQPEYYVQFEDLKINYGHMKDVEFAVDHTDDISYFGEVEPDRYTIQAESESGVKYTYQTSESDKDVLEYYETWNEDEFGEMYRGGASLSRCN